ncbi:dihydropteroate synthase [Endozoicomonas sp. (ex Bugula neritina AB1)]|nr:dihydropteroate synthase [Endozoicomonas sp. (ex Bugula neritina AB1)]
MGVLNITPDSFFSGSRCQDSYLKVAEQMVLDGADILDVGGESTRPGAAGAPTAEQELERILPVVEALVSRFDTVISVDTSSALVMRESVGAGVGMINDVRALRREGALEAAVAVNVPVILMHSLIESPEVGFEPYYDDVVQEVMNSLVGSVERCVNAGIAHNQLIIDPGFGGGMFGKTPAYDLQMLKGFSRFHRLELPVLAGMSRKSFIGAVLNNQAEERLSGSLAVAALAAQAGAHIVRVHDVAETLDVVRMVNAVRES